MKRTELILLLAGLMFAGSAAASMYITEWMYGGYGGEFVELTNLGAAAVDMTGWSFDDDRRVAGMFDLSGFGIVAPGQSVILTEDNAEDFRQAWGLSDSVKIIGGLSRNLGRNDEINIFDAAETLIDRLTYGDQSFSGSLRTQYVSGNILLIALGQNDPFSAVKSEPGDAFGSWTSTPGDVGNPGLYIPEPATLTLLGLGFGAMLRRRTL